MQNTDHTFIFLNAKHCSHVFQVLAGLWTSLRTLTLSIQFFLQIYIQKRMSPRNLGIWKVQHYNSVLSLPFTDPICTILLEMKLFQWEARDPIRQGHQRIILITLSKRFVKLSVYVFSLTCSNHILHTTKQIPYKAVMHVNIRLTSILLLLLLLLLSIHNYYIIWIP